MHAFDVNDSFVIAVKLAKERASKLRLEPVIIDTVPLHHNSVTGIVVGGLGPDLNAPCLYRPWSNSDFAGGVYNYHRGPQWYVSCAFTDNFKSLAFYPLIVELFSGIINVEDPIAVLRVIWHIVA